jgi:hypothetical protein
VIVRDRVTGVRWHAGDTGFATWTASTIKLAIATDLLQRQRAGTMVLADADRPSMDRMLRNSDNDATEALWARYDGAGMPARFRGYGMTGLDVVPGYDPHWRYLRCTVEDLQRLMSYALESTAPPDRAYLLQTMRGVDGNQRWGVWAAGPGQAPGNKDGWAYKPDRRPDHWVTHTVGFAGPDARYVVAVMYDQPAGATVATGVQAVSDLVATLFGASLPASVAPP